MSDHVGDCEELENAWVWWCACKGDERTQQAILNKKTRQFQTVIEPVHERVLIEALTKLGYAVTRKKAAPGPEESASLEVKNQASRKMLIGLFNRWRTKIVPGVFAHGCVRTKLKLPNGYTATVTVKEGRSR